MGVSEQKTSPTGFRSHRSVGTNTAKIDSVEKVTGSALYGSDLAPDRLLHAAVLRSNIPHGRITNVDTSGVEELDNVISVVTRDELLGIFDDRVRHYGDIIAAVAAEDRRTAVATLQHIDYDIEPLEGVFDAREALSSEAPTIHENNPDLRQHGRHEITVENDAFEQNIDDYHKVVVGDVDQGFEEADFVYEAEYASPRVGHCNLDTHCCVADWVDDTLVLIETLGSPGRVQEELAHFLGLDTDCVRIETPPTASSSFGGRSLQKRSLEPVAATIAQQTGRPVKVWFDREEEFTATETRHRTYYTIKMGVTKEGDITAVQMDVVADTGGYPNGVGHIVLSNSKDRPLDLYRIPNYRYEGVSVFTNNVPAGEYRGIGSTQMTFAFESHIDEIARQTGIDPAEFRLRNFVEEGDERPHTGAPIESCGVAECLQRGTTTFDQLNQGEASDSNRLRGQGFAAGAHTTASGAHGKDSSEARLTLKTDGTLQASTAAIDHGQGAKTVMAQIISEETGIPTTRINVERFETTDELDDILGSVASRSTYIIGATVLDAAEAMSTTLREGAAERFDVPVSDVELTDGTAKTTDGRDVPVESLIGSENQLVVYGKAESNLCPPSYGVHFAEVEIDIDTGHLDVLTYVAAQDVGFAINPKMVEGQLEGAIQHGTEFALYSEVKLDQGSPINANLADYPAISPWEMPEEIAIEIIESNDKTGPFGAKGIGTPAMPPIAPAIANAIRDATGTRFSQPPIDPEQIHAAIHDY